MNDKKKNEPPCVALIAGLEKGQTAAEIEIMLRDAVRGAQSTGKKTSVTITLNIEKSDEDSVRITPDVSCKIPKAPRKSQTFFTRHDGALARTSERQPEIPEVTRAEEAAEAEAAPVRNNGRFRVVDPAAASA